MFTTHIILGSIDRSTFQR